MSLAALCGLRAGWSQNPHDPGPDRSVEFLIQSGGHTHEWDGDEEPNAQRQRSAMTTNMARKAIPSTLSVLPLVQVSRQLSSAILPPRALGGLASRSTPEKVRGRQ